jgi:ankyrin repeat protein
MVELLLRRKCRRKCIKQKHYMALIMASSKGYESIVRRLIKSNANFDITSGMGTVLNVAASSASKVTEWRASMILGKDGLKLKIEGERFGTPLYTAAFYGHHRVAKELLDHGFNVNEMSKEFGSTGVLKHKIQALT